MTKNYTKLKNWPYEFFQQINQKALQHYERFETTKSTTWSHGAGANTTDLYMGRLIQGVGWGGLFTFSFFFGFFLIWCFSMFLVFGFFVLAFFFQGILFIKRCSFLMFNRFLQRFLVDFNALKPLPPVFDLPRTSEKMWKASKVLSGEKLSVSER